MDEKTLEQIVRVAGSFGTGVAVVATNDPCRCYRVRNHKLESFPDTRILLKTLRDFPNCCAGEVVSICRSRIDKAIYEMSSDRKFAKRLREFRLSEEDVQRIISKASYCDLEIDITDLD